MNKEKLNNQLKTIKKELGKPSFSQYIFEEINLSSKIFMILGAIFSISISLLLWYSFYLNQNDYWILAIALFMSLAFFIVYDTYTQIKYKEFIFIGDRGIAIVKVRQKDEIVKDAQIIYFDKIDKITIDKEHHYSIGRGGEMVEHLSIISDKKIIFDINPNKIEDYDKLKKVLIELYSIYQIRRKEDINIKSNDESVFSKHILVLIPLFMILINIVYNIFGIGYYSKVVALMSIASMSFLSIVVFRLVLRIIIKKRNVK